MSTDNEKIPATQRENSPATPTVDSPASTTTPNNDKKRRFKRHMTPPIELDPETAKVLWRDFCFILLGCVSISIIGFVESHASETGARFISARIGGLFELDEIPMNPFGIVDTGFILTNPLYEWLRDNRDWNDTLAALNSIALLVPTLYTAYVTAFLGDYSAVFRVLALELLRAFCGWFTYLPPDPTYLASYYDVPDVIHCMFQVCEGEPKAIPFVSFFSGHVAAMVVAGNHMWLSGHKRFAVFTHFLNVLQTIRLLATRGHYSIDMIIGWYVAVYVTNPAGRLGRFYSRGMTWNELMPTNAQEAFESFTGVSDTLNEQRMSVLLQRPEVQEALKKVVQEEAHLNQNQSETTVRILQDTASRMMQEQAQVFQERIHNLQEQARQSGIALPSSKILQEQAQLFQQRLRELQEQARQAGIPVPTTEMDDKKTQ